jgi:phospholipid transport system substrate-binding protein
MRIEKSRVLLKKYIFFGIICAVCQTLYAQTSPLPVLEQTANQIIDTLKTHQSQLKTDPNIVNQVIQRYLLPHVDVVGMSRSVLGREAWMKATPAEKTDFTQVFTKLVIRTYASPLRDYSGETIKFLPIRGSYETRFVRVNSVISRPNGQNIPLSYQLVWQNNQWKIYDLNVEGVSLLQSFRSQFGNMLQHSTLRDLILHMQKMPKKGS